MQCPGQDSRYWDGGAIFDIPCPHCGETMEFFKDEGSRICAGCGNRVLNPKIDFGCALYCPYADKCLGAVPAQLLAKRQENVKEQAAIELKKYLGKDFRRMGTAIRAARFGERISTIAGDAPWDTAKGGNPAVIHVAALLMGAAPRKTSTDRTEEVSRTSGMAQERPTAPMMPAIDPFPEDWAGAILAASGANSDLVAEIRLIWANLAAGVGKTINEQIIHDAVLLGQMEAQLKKSGIAKAEPDTETLFQTAAGRAIMKELLTTGQES